jgi:DNA-binding NarL/FixJ family response regulator
MDGRIYVDSAPHLPLALKALTIIAKPDLFRECLASWLAGACKEFETITVSSPDDERAENSVRRAAVVILSASDGRSPSAALADQITWVRAVHRDVPITFIGDPDMRMAEDLLQRLDLQGYIPTTSTSEVAAAALRLIAAGGLYIPFTRAPDPANERLMPSDGLPLITPDAAALLTPRERKVMDCLRRGLPNKIIAYELKISMGTVKLHVHNIIVKLKVHNRTEAAVTRRWESYEADRLAGTSL